jgi:hypothetical protein
MQLFAKDPTGRVYVLNDLDPSDLVEALKQRIAAQSDYDVEDQCLLYESELLEDNHCLSDYSIQVQPILVLVPSQVRAYNCCKGWGIGKGGLG